jgi:hypothetical protein
LLRDLDIIRNIFKPFTTASLCPVNTKKRVSYTIKIRLAVLSSKRIIRSTEVDKTKSQSLLLLSGIAQTRKKCITNHGCSSAGATGQ